MDTTTAHPRPLTSAHLQAWGLGTANEGAQQQLQRGPGRGKLRSTLRGQGASSESPHVANVPSPVAKLTNTSLHLWTLRRPSQANGVPRQRNATATEHKSVRLMHSETKQYRNIGVWSRERFIAGPRVVIGARGGNAALRGPTPPTVNVAVIWSRRRQSP